MDTVVIVQNDNRFFAKTKVEKRYSHYWAQAQVRTVLAEERTLC